MRKCFICGDTEEFSRIYSSKWSNGEDVCNKHLLHFKRHGRVLDNFPSRRKAIRNCDFCGTDESVTIYKGHGEYQGKLLCTRHKSQVKLYGKALERTKYDKNEIELFEFHAEICLYDIEHNEIARAIIDLDDVEKVSEYKWGYDKTNGYAQTRNDKKEHLGMHQFIMNTKGTNYLVDHKDRDGLNNRKNNLRVADKSINAVNVGLRSNNNSGVTGVSWCKSQEKWRCNINYNGKRIELGYYNDIRNAIITRLDAELEYYPDHPPQSHLFEEYGIKWRNGNV